MEIQDTIITVDEVDSNGLFYPRDVVIQAVRDYKDRPDLKAGKITSETGNGQIELHQITHKIKRIDFIEDKNCVDAEIELLDTAAARIVYHEPYAYHLNPVLIAHITEQGDGTAIVEELEIIRVDLIYKPEYAVNKFVEDISPIHSGS